MRFFAASLFVVFLLLLTTLTACKNNKDELLNPVTSCDTLGMSYRNDVVPILSANCYSCHRSASNAGGPDLDSYQLLKIQADNGALVGTITHAPGFDAMPRGASKMDDCSIARIRSWVREGAADN